MTEQVEKAEAENVRLPMVCICRTQIEGTEEFDDSRRVEADALRARAREILTWDSEHPCTEADFLTRAIAHLDEYGADISFAVDQWFGVYAKVSDLVKREGEIPAGERQYERLLRLRVSVECDRIEDGLAALVVWFKENRTPDQ